MKAYSHRFGAKFARIFVHIFARIMAFLILEKAK